MGLVPLGRLSACPHRPTPRTRRAGSPPMDTPAKCDLPVPQTKQPRGGRAPSPTRSALGQSSRQTGLILDAEGFLQHQLVMRALPASRGGRPGPVLVCDTPQPPPEF